MKRYIITALCAFVAYCAWGQLTHQTHVPSLSQYHINIVGDSCVELLAQNVELTSHPEQPELPVFYYTFILPTHSHVISVEPLGRSVTQRTIPLPIKCSPPAMTANGEISRANSTNETAPQYLTEELYIVSDGYFDGDIHLVTVAYSPINYVRGAKKFTYTTIPQFVVRFQSGDPEGMSPITPRNRNHSKRIAMIQNMVDNPQNASTYVPTTPTVSSDSILLGNAQSLPGMGYEYLVITTDDLYDTAQKLIDWKRSKGIHAGVIRYEDIRDTIIYDTQTEYPEIDDAAGNLRKYLRNAHANGLQYLFLVGSAEEIPYRYGYGKPDNKESASYIPTDFYFSELNSNWDKNGDGWYAQFKEDTITYEAEIHVGRLITDSEMEFSAYIDKLITYERNPGWGDQSYLSKALFTQADEMQWNFSNNGQARQTIDNALFAFPDTTILEEYPDNKNSIYPKGSDVINELNNRYGYFSMFSHGSPMGVKTCQNHSVKPLNIDTVTEFTSFDVIKEVNDGIDLVNDYRYPFFVFTITCTSMPFDSKSYNYNGFTRTDVTVGQSFVNRASAVAFIGNTRVGYISHSYRHQIYFHNYISNYSIAEGLSLSKQDLHRHGNFMKEHISLASNLLGCPEIHLWTAIPQKLTNVASNDMVYVTPLFSNASPQLMSYSEVQSNSLYNQNHSIAKIRQNFYPFFLRIELQNITLQSKHTVFGADIEIGRSVKPNATQGDFVIGNNGELNIETTGTVTLKQGTVITPGGKLSIKHIKQ